ncbi:MAG: hypothetical protein H6681_00895 [Desulfobacteraceae bacterium]|nr:hypothetical protein [Desulfobacteraceae bacterium]
MQTFDDPDILISDGLFKISRNPMYLGFLIALLGNSGHRNLFIKASLHFL